MYASDLYAGDDRSRPPSPLRRLSAASAATLAEVNPSGLLYSRVSAFEPITQSISWDGGTARSHLSWIR